MDYALNRAAMSVAVKAVFASKAKAHEEALRLLELAPEGVAYVVEPTRWVADDAQAALHEHDDVVLAAISSAALRALPSETLSLLNSRVQEELALRGRVSRIVPANERWALTIAQGIFEAATPVTTAGAGYDLITAEGERVEVKMTQRRGRHPTIRLTRSESFDLLFIIVVLDTGRVETAAILTSAAVDRLAKPTPQGRVLKLTPAAFAGAGVSDVTDRVDAVAKSLILG